MPGNGEYGRRDYGDVRESRREERDHGDGEGDPLPHDPMIPSRSTPSIKEDALRGWRDGWMV